MTNRDSILVDVKETKDGLRELKDFNNLFGYNVKLPSETIGKLRRLSKAQINEIFPNSAKYLAMVNKLTKYIKTHGGGINVESYAFRVHHIKPMLEFLEIASRLQFIKALDDQMNVYMEDDVDWHVFDIDYKYQDGKLVDTFVTLGGEVLDLSEPVRIQAIDWLGNLVDGIQIVDRNAGKVDRQIRRGEHGEVISDAEGRVIYDEIKLPVNIAIQIAEDSLSNSSHYEKLAARDGAINKSDISDTLLYSPLNYMVMRLADDERDEEAGIIPVGYETPIFKVLDYSHEIDFGEHLKVLGEYRKMRDLDTFYNTREFATLNLLRWGIVDVDEWKLGLMIFNAVLNAPKLWENDTAVDGKVVAWGNQVISELMQRPENKGKNIADDVIMSGSAISKIASVSSQSYFRARALLVSNVTENDVEFRDSYITFRYKKERTNKFQSLSRLNTDIYKIIECDKDGNMIQVISPLHVFAIVNHDITAVVVKLDATFEGAEVGEVTPNQEHMAYYNAINAFKTPDHVLLGLDN